MERGQLVPACGVPVDMRTRGVSYVSMRGSVGGGITSCGRAMGSAEGGWRGGGNHASMRGGALMESGVQLIRASGGQLVNGGTCVSNRPGLPSWQQRQEQRAMCSARSSNRLRSASHVVLP
jgi:hypothetical protein